MSTIDDLPGLMRRLFAARNTLAGLFPCFNPSSTFFEMTPIAQAWAAYMFDLRVWSVRNTRVAVNAMTKSGELVQVWNSDLNSEVIDRQVKHFLSMVVGSDGGLMGFSGGPVEKLFAHAKCPPSKKIYETTDADQDFWHEEAVEAEMLPVVRRSQQARDESVRANNFVNAFPPPKIEDVPARISELLAAERALNSIFADIHFVPVQIRATPIAQAWAAYLYGLTVWDADFYTDLNAMTQDGAEVRVEAVTAEDDDIGLLNVGKYLAVLQIGEDGSQQEIFNGPGALVWPHAYEGGIREPARAISISTLKELAERVPQNLRLPLVRT